MLVSVACVLGVYFKGKGIKSRGRSYQNRIWGNAHEELTGSISRMV